MASTPKLSRTVGIAPPRGRAPGIQAAPFTEPQGGALIVDNGDNSAQSTWCPPGTVLLAGPPPRCIELPEADKGDRPDPKDFSPSELTWAGHAAPQEEDGNGLPPLPRPKEQEFPWWVLAAGLLAAVVVGRA